MNLNNKKILINNLKIKLESLIKDLLIQIPINFGLIKNNLDEHYSFINFTKSMNIYEDYKWVKIKKDYNEIKKKYNLDKKLYPQIIKIYGTINNYYSLDEFNDKNNIIQKINNDLLKIEFEKLKELHRILTNKRKNYIKTMGIIKIYETNDDIEKLINKLHTIYTKLKQIKKDKYIIKNIYN
jgi:hypothetical protein